MHRRTTPPSRRRSRLPGAAGKWRSASALFLMLLTVVGCDSAPPTVPVNGTVLYNGEPLEFGSVTFQPRSGQPARGEIQPDGSFTLSTFKPGDGAVPGTHKVRITCYESQNPSAPRSAGEQALGKSLIPRSYTLFDQSGLTAEVQDGATDPFVFELEGP